MSPEFLYTTASESQLNELLAGRESGVPLMWHSPQMTPAIRSGSTGVLLRKFRRDGNDLLQPLVLVVPEEDLRRLYGRVAQVRSDFSPLSAWCHVISPERFRALGELVRNPDLEGWEAAWSGAAIAEALLLSERPISQLRLSACFSTYSFAFARELAVWGKPVPNDTTIARFESASKLFRGTSPRSEARAARVRSAFLPIWSALSDLCTGTSLQLAVDSSIASALRALRRARSFNGHEDESQALATPLMSHIPEADSFRRLQTMPPESRLRLFDQLVRALDEMPAEQRSLRRSGLTLLAGYLATVAAGGMSSLSLAENTAARWPEIVAWAYVIGGISEAVLWTSGFDGLGRYVARELMRPARFDEPPSCDFAIDEALALFDPQLSDPLVHLRIKQARVATVALIAGVNISVAISDNSQADTTKEIGRQTDTLTTSNRDIIQALADALWPHLRARIEESGRTLDDGGVQGSRGKRKSHQPPLPLKDSRK